MCSRRCWLIQRLLELQPPWSVNTFAQAVSEAAFGIWNTFNGRGELPRARATIRRTLLPAGTHGLSRKGKLPAGQTRFSARRCPVAGGENAGPRHCNSNLQQLSGTRRPLLPGGGAHRRRKRAAAGSAASPARCAAAKCMPAVAGDDHGWLGGVAVNPFSATVDEARPSSWSKPRLSVPALVAFDLEKRSGSGNLADGGEGDGRASPRADYSRYRRLRPPMRQRIQLCRDHGFTRCLTPNCWQHAAAARRGG